MLTPFSTLLFFSFRNISASGDYYTGGYKQGSYYGKGEEEWADGSREISYIINDKKEGAAKYFDKNGKERDMFYVDDERV